MPERSLTVVVNLIGIHQHCVQLRKDNFINVLRKRLIYAVETFGGLDSIDANLYVNNVYLCNQLCSCLCGEPLGA